MPLTILNSDHRAYRLGWKRVHDTEMAFMHHHLRRSGFDLLEISQSILEDADIYFEDEKDEPVYQDGDIPKDKQMSPETRAELERKRKERRSKKVEAPVTPTAAVPPSSKSKEVSTITNLEPTNADKDKCQLIINEEKRMQQKACP